MQTRAAHRHKACGQRAAWESRPAVVHVRQDGMADRYLQLTKLESQQLPGSARCFSDRRGERSAAQVRGHARAMVNYVVQIKNNAARVLESRLREGYVHVVQIDDFWHMPSRRSTANPCVLPPNACACTSSTSVTHCPLPTPQTETHSPPASTLPPPQRSPPRWATSPPARSSPPAGRPPSPHTPLHAPCAPPPCCAR